MTTMENNLTRGSSRHFSGIRSYDTMVPVTKVKVTLTNGDQTIVKYTTKTGTVSFYSVPIGTWKVTAEHKLYQKDVKEKIGIDNKHVERVAVALRGVIVSSI